MNASDRFALNTENIKANPRLSVVGNMIEQEYRISYIELITFYTDGVFSAHSE